MSSNDANPESAANKRAGAEPAGTTGEGDFAVVEAPLSGNGASVEPAASGAGPQQSVLSSMAAAGLASVDLGALKQQFQEYAANPSKIPTGRFESCVYGAAQPIVAIRMLLRHGALMRRAIVPALSFAALCALLVLDEAGGGVWSIAQHTYLALVAAAPISPVLFSRSYARLAAKAQAHAGYGQRQPYLRSTMQAATETVLQLVVLGAGLFPVYVVLTLLPLEAVTIAGASALWALHWIFVEALDSARTSAPSLGAAIDLDGSSSSASERGVAARPPWYERVCAPRLPKSAAFLAAPLRWWGRTLGRLTRRWWPEVQVGEDHPWLAVGFTACAALVLAIPGINLFFRPVIVVAAALISAELEARGNGTVALPGE